MRYPPVYENSEIREWREKNLRSQKLLKKYATEFKRHYAGATACAPSRTTLFTGQYPSLHGVSQTPGMAKESADPDVFWLDENTVPTMGDYFKANGYKTFYKGKWHISNADIIIPGTNNPLNSFNPDGTPNEKYTEIYAKANRLQGYGFDGWIGPEPHGANPNDSGSSAPSGAGGRDIIYTKEVISLLKKLDKSCEKDPWLVVASLVNPHDITLFGDYTETNPNYNFEIDPTLPYIPKPPTENENLSTKPVAQQSYKEVYPQALQPISNIQKYQQLYYSLERSVDNNLYRIMKTIMKSSMYKDTIIIFTSDHGEQLGAHGLFQKWHNIYEESIHVPLIIHSPALFSGYTATNELTSHVDLIPTLLALANIDVKCTQKKLQKDHSEVRPLVGKRICFPKIDETQIKYRCDSDYRCDCNFNKCYCNKHRNSLKRTKDNDPETSAIYFLTQDEPTSGLHQVNMATKEPYESVIQPNNIEAIITYVSGDLYKYARYFNPNNATNQQYEMYNLSTDHLEINNLADPLHSTPETEKIKQILERVLIQQRRQKRLRPTGFPASI